MSEVILESSSQQTISPGVVVDGVTVHPPGFFYVIALAINGDAWALEETKKPEFDTMVQAWIKERKLQGLQCEADALQERLDQVKMRMEQVRNDKVQYSTQQYSRMRE